MKPIRFAPIPKCASRSLSALGILGEITNHSKVTVYPDYKKYDWYYVTRDDDEWYRSYWLQLKADRSPFALRLGMTFESFEKDMPFFNKPIALAPLDGETGVNSWIPNDVAQSFRKYLESGKGFKQFCTDTILDGVATTPIHIHDLDAWLIKHGHEPRHENVKQVFIKKTKIDDAEYLSNLATHQVVFEGAKGGIWRRQIVLSRKGSHISYHKPNHPHMLYIIRGKVRLTTWKEGADGTKHPGTSKDFNISAPSAIEVKTGTYHKLTAMSDDVIAERIFALRDCKTGDYTNDWDGSSNHYEARI